MNSDSRDAYYPFRSIRARTGLIFFVGLLILVSATLIITLVISRGIRDDTARLLLLAGARAEVAAWATGSGPDAHGAPSAGLRDSLALLLNGGSLLQGEGASTPLPPPIDGVERLVLQQASAAWAALAVPDGAADTAQLAALQTALAEAEGLVRQRRDGNTGMVRGMYAALFIASLIFLLIGLWFIQQTIVSPLEALHLAVRRIAAGDLDTPATLGGPGEFRELAYSFEGMRVELRAARARQERWASDLEAHVTQRTNQLVALSQVIAAASRSLALEQVLSTALAQSLQAMDLGMGGIWLFDETSHALNLVASSGMSEAMQRQLATVGTHGDATGHVDALGQAIVLEDLAQAPQVIRSIALQEGVRGMIAAPIKLRDRMLGVLGVMTQQPRTFAPDEWALLTSVGQQIGIAVDNLRLLQEVREQTQRVVALQERERIGIELHDGLLQTLGYLFLRTDQLEALAAAHGVPDLAQQLATQRDVLEAASDEARRFIAELSELPPPPAALQEALAETIAAFSLEHALSVSLHTSGPSLVLDAERVAHLTRIVREALTNAAQHGHAKRAFVNCRNDGSAGEIAVCDDGCGFDVGRLPDDGRPHFGLSVMQARAARIGGVLQIESHPGQGACVRVIWAQH